jgi:hypothetical protein
LQIKGDRVISCRKESPRLRQCLTPCIKHVELASVLTALLKLTDC